MVSLQCTTMYTGFFMCTVPTLQTRLLRVKQAVKIGVSKLINLVQNRYLCWHASCVHLHPQFTGMWLWLQDCDLTSIYMTVTSPLFTGLWLLLHPQFTGLWLLLHPLFTWLWLLLYPLFTGLWPHLYLQNCYWDNTNIYRIVTDTAPTIYRTVTVSALTIYRTLTVTAPTIYRTVTVTVPIIYRTVTSSLITGLWLWQHQYLQDFNG